ncbi:MAG TPA: hypothetical protein PLY34_06945 [Ferruginibacter sp.]|nr:hypothetical protein [Ferruginibacter sp.]HPH91230.1 hypothetical protein [Ferruginibacter sp.]
MKSLLYTLLTFSVCIVLCGCPYESFYPIDKDPQQYIDESLLGKWASFVARPSFENEYIESPVKIIFEKRSDMEYNIAITGYIDDLRKFKVVENDTIRGVGFISVIDSRQFLNTQIRGKYYIAEIKRVNELFSLLTLKENFTAKFVKSSTELRNALQVHYKTKPEPSYDDWFVAKNLQKVN